MLKNIWLLFALPTLFFANNLAFSQASHLEMKETLVIGQEDSDSLEYLFGNIKSIDRHINGDIYIVNSSEKSVRIFSPNGKFKSEVGTRGRGPGEFYDIFDISIDKERNLVILDRLQSRITKFNSQGDLVFANNIPDDTQALAQFIFHGNNDQTYVLYRNSEKGRFTDENFIHTYDSDFKEKRDSHLNLFETFFDRDSPIERKLSISPSYLATQFGDGKIALVPHMYTGQVAVFDTHTKQVDLFGERIDKPYELIDVKKAKKLRDKGETGISSYSGQDGTLAFRFTATNIALVGNDDFLLLYYVLHKNKRMYSRVQIFNTEGKMLLDESLDEQKLNYIVNNRFSILPKYLDDKNKLYLSDYRYKGTYPAVRVFETNLESFKE